jgi:hypothetical protein
MSTISLLVQLQTLNEILFTANGTGVMRISVIGPVPIFLVKSQVYHIPGHTQGFMSFERNSRINMEQRATGQNPLKCLL